MFFCVYYLIRICNLDLEKFDKIFSVAARVKRLLHSFVGSSDVQEHIRTFNKFLEQSILCRKRCMSCSSYNDGSTSQLNHIIQKDMYGCSHKTILLFKVVSQRAREKFCSIKCSIYSSCFWKWVYDTAILPLDYLPILY